MYFYNLTDLSSELIELKWAHLISLFSTIAVYLACICCAYFFLLLKLENNFWKVKVVFARLCSFFQRVSAYGTWNSPTIPIATAIIHYLLLSHDSGMKYGVETLRRTVYWMRLRVQACPQSCYYCADFSMHWLNGCYIRLGVHFFVSWSVLGLPRVKVFALGYFYIISLFKSEMVRNADLFFSNVKFTES